MFLLKYHIRAGVWLKIRDFHWVNVILSYVSSKEELFNFFQPNRFLPLKLKLYIASSCGRMPNNSAPVIKTRIFIFCFTFWTVCNCVNNKSQLSMEERDENLMLSHLENGSAHSENNGAKQKRKFLLKGVSTEFSQH